MSFVSCEKLNKTVAELEDKIDKVAQAMPAAQNIEWKKCDDTPLTNADRVATCDDLTPLRNDIALNRADLNNANINITAIGTAANDAKTEVQNLKNSMVHRTVIYDNNQAGNSFVNGDVFILTATSPQDLFIRKNEVPLDKPLRIIKENGAPAITLHAEDGMQFVIPNGNSTDLTLPELKDVVHSSFYEMIVTSQGMIHFAKISDNLYNLFLG